MPPQADTAHVQPAADHRRADIYLSSVPFLDSVLDVFKPIKNLWDVTFVQNLGAFLNFLYVHLQTVPVIDAIGAYGVAVVILTIMIRLVLAPLQQFQLVTQRRSMMEQRKLAPDVAELRKKFKKDPQKLNAEMMKLYQEHGVNPLGGLVGCLPLIVQLPILTALYYVFANAARAAHHPAPFLFVPNLNDCALPGGWACPSSAVHHLMFAGLPIPALVYLAFPVLAAITTFVQSKMLQMPTPPNPTDQELQTQQMQRTMVYLSPLMIAYFALNVPAGLGLYWFVGNCVSIIQQSFVVGWGTLLPARFRRPPAGTDPRSGTVPKKGPGDGPRSSPNNGPKNGPRNVPNNGSGNGSRRRRRRR